MADNFFCSLCGIQCGGPAAYVQHLRGKRHLRTKSRSRNFAVLGAAAQDSSASSDRPDRYFCGTCDVQCTSPENYKQHCDGKKHQRNIQRKKMGFLDPVSEAGPVDDFGSDPTIGLGFVKTEPLIPFTVDPTDESAAAAGPSPKLSPTRRRWTPSPTDIPFSGDVDPPHAISRSGSGDRVVPEYRPEAVLLPMPSIDGGDLRAKLIEVIKQISADSEFVHSRKEIRSLRNQLRDSEQTNQILEVKVRAQEVEIRELKQLASGSDGDA